MRKKKKRSKIALDFAGKLNYYKNRKKIHSNQIADRLGICRQTLYQWEQGKFVPPLDKAVLISRFLGFSLDILGLGGSQIKNEEKPVLKKENEVVLKPGVFKVGSN